MARSDFGGTSNDFLFRSAPFMRLTSGTLTFWSAATGGTQHTDLLLNGGAVTQIPVPASGFIPTFQGPDGITEMWADEGAVGGARIRMVAEGRQGPAGGAGPAGAPGGSDASFAGWIADTTPSATRTALQAAVNAQVPVALATDPTPAAAAAAAVTTALTNGQAKGVMVDTIVASTGTTTTENNVLDPNVANTTASYSAANPTGGVWAYSRVVNGSTDGKKNVWRATVTTRSTATGANTGPFIGCGQTGASAAATYRTPAAPGEVWSGGVTVKSSVATTAFVAIGYWNGASFVGSLPGVLANLSAGVETELQVLAKTIPASTTAIAVIVRVNASQDLTVGATFDLSRSHLNKSATLNAYRDGDDADSKWAGTAGASKTLTAKVDIPAAIAATLATGAGKPAALSVLTASAGPRVVDNLCPYPSPPVGLTPWAASFGTGASGTATYSATAGHGATPALVMTWTAVSTMTGSDTGPSSGPNGAAGRFPVTAGKVYNGSMWAKSSVGGVGVRCVVEWYNSGGTFLSRSTGFGKLQPFLAGEEWRLYSGPCVAPATAAFAAVVARPDNVSGFGSAGVLTLSQAMVSAGWQPRPYRDGTYTDTAWTGATAASASIGRLGSAAPLIVMYGDSMFQLAQDGGKPLPDWVTTTTGMETLNFGRGGETSTGIAMRQGGLDVLVTVSGGSIPTSGSVNCTVTPATTWRDDASWNFYGEIAGVPGTLQRPVGVTSAGNPWTFTPFVYPASPVAVLPGTRWKSYLAADYAQVTILQGGNNLPNQADILRDMAAMTTRVRDFGGRFLVMSMFNNSTQGSGTGGYTTMQAINAALAAAYGSSYVDVRSWLIANGLAAVGITPTGGDTTDIAADIIPRSLMQGDGIHPNDAGRHAEAIYLNQVIDAKQLLAA